MTINAAFVAIELFALSVAAQWAASGTDVRVRQSVRSIYALPLPLIVRTLTAQAPMWALLLALLGLLIALPSPIAGWLTIIFFDGFALALLVCYRRPEWLLPRWLREEVDQRTVELARPSMYDWLYFALLFPSALFMNIGVPVIMH